MLAKRQAQIHMDDKHIENSELLDLLTHRDDAKEAEGRAHATFNGWDTKAKALVETLNLPQGRVRVGPFLIITGTSKSKSVSFKTEGGKRTVRIYNTEVQEEAAAAEGADSE